MASTAASASPITQHITYIAELIYK